MTIPATTSSGAPADPSAGADRPALVVVLHGTRSPAGSEDAELLRRRVCDRLPGTRVDVGWVDVHEETLERTLPAAGPAIVVPAFLSAGHHVTHDIPTAIERTHGRARTTSHVGPDLDPALRDRLTELGPLGDGVVLAAASPWLPWLFTSEAAVASAARPALLVAASAMPLAGAVFLFDGILMGAGDGRYLAGAGLVTLVPYAPLAVAVAHGLPASASPAGGLAWLWAAFAWVFMGARGLTTGLRARGTAWRR